MNKIRIFVSILLVSFSVIFFGCESNDQTVVQHTTPPPNDTTEGKKILLEFFTNAGCNPCIAAHGYLEQINALTGITFNDTNVIIISYHTRFPFSNDSLYRANVPHNDARINYYGVNFTPQGRNDGITLGTFAANDWTAQLNAEFLTTNYMDITLTDTYDTVSRSGSVTASFNVFSNLETNDNVIHVLITEDNIPYLSAPNGITHPDNVMRTLVTGTTGENITLSLGTGNPDVSKSFTISPNWNQNECYLTVFIQSISTKKVYGVERIKVRLYY